MKTTAALLTAVVVTVGYLGMGQGSVPLPRPAEDDLRALGIELLKIEMLEELKRPREFPVEYPAPGYFGHGIRVLLG